MSKKIINKLLPLKGNKRAVSPVIAAILLIALTVSAAAIIYFVVVPMLKGKGQLVMMSSATLIDTNADDAFDTLDVNLYNIGSADAELSNAIITIHTIEQSISAHKGIPTPTFSIKSVSFTWNVTSSKTYLIQEEKKATFQTLNSDHQIDPFSQFEVQINFNGGSLSLGLQFAGYPSGGSETPELPEYLSSALVYRTSANDPSTCRSSFPTTGGYSPRLWFLLGIFRSGTSGLCGNTQDYINDNGFGVAENYRPYIGIEDEFSTLISHHTGYKSMAYNDSGLYPGCVTFTGNSFDPNDNLNWPQRGVVYMFSYIYNPTDITMDVDISIQADDSFMFWVNSELKAATYSTSQWNRWVTPVRISLNPGYNIFTLRATDNGGNWDAQVLFWDAGTTDPITSLLNVWPLTAPTSIYW